jgi:hypothetical protein
MEKKPVPIPIFGRAREKLSAINFRRFRFRLKTMAVSSASTSEILEFITGDFTDAWNALAMVPESGGPWSLRHRCNYLFAMHSMVFLEWICRLCKSDPTKRALQDFSNELNAIEPHYFTEIPNDCNTPGVFELPTIKRLSQKRLLLSALFDLLRNGLAHRYEEIIVPLMGGDLAIELLGAQHCHWLDTVVQFRSTRHLSYRLSQGDIFITVHPGILFLDFKAAFENAHLADSARNLVADPFQRGSLKGNYQFSPQALESALQVAGHLGK